MFTFMKMSLVLLLLSVVLPHGNCFIKRINDIIEVNYIIVE